MNQKKIQEHLPNAIDPKDLPKDLRPPVEQPEFIDDHVPGDHERGNIEREHEQTGAAAMKTDEKRDGEQGSEETPR
ncbi:MAG TPA: hypothetical protein VIK74_07940 [Parasegetibacter sp.]